MIELKEPTGYYTFNHNNKQFFYDIESGFFSEVDQLFIDIAELRSRKYDPDHIIEALQISYPVEEIRNYLAEINHLTEEQELFYPYFKEISRFRQKRSLNRVQHLWLNIVHECNLNCIYCYGDGGSYGHQVQWMDKETATAAIDYWFERLDRNANKIVVSFFGGEPLLNKEIFLYGLDEITKRCTQAGIAVTFRMTTNGTIMDDEILNALALHKIHPLISIDGPREIQNKNRPYNNGNPTFDKILTTVRKLKEHYKVLHGRITVTHEFVPDLVSSVINLWNLGISNVSFAGVSTMNEELSLTKDDLPILFDHIKTLREMTYQHILSGTPGVFMPLYDKCLLIHNRIMAGECSFEKSETLIITPDGNIHKCHRLLERDDMIVGSVFTDRDPEKIKPKYRTAKSNPCSYCWAQYLCGGGCPQENLLYNGDFNSPYAIKCSLEKTIIKEAFQLYTAIYEYDQQLLDRIFSL